MLRGTPEKTEERGWKPLRVSKVPTRPEYSWSIVSVQRAPGSGSFSSATNNVPLKTRHETVETVRERPGQEESCGLEGKGTEVQRGHEAAKWWP